MLFSMKKVKHSSKNASIVTLVKYEIRDLSFKKESRNFRQKRKYNRRDALMADAQLKKEKGSISQRDKSITMRPGNLLNIGLHALRGKNGPFRKLFFSSYVVAYIILIRKLLLYRMTVFKFQKCSRSNIFPTNAF